MYTNKFCAHPAHLARRRFHNVPLSRVVLLGWILWLWSSTFMVFSLQIGNFQYEVYGGYSHLLCEIIENRAMDGILVIDSVTDA